MKMIYVETRPSERASFEQCQLGYRAGVVSTITRIMPCYGIKRNIHGIVANIQVAAQLVLKPIATKLKVSAMGLGTSPKLCGGLFERWLKKSLKSSHSGLDALFNRQLDCLGKLMQKDANMIDRSITDLANATKSEISVKAGRTSTCFPERISSHLLRNGSGIEGKFRIPVQRFQRRGRKPVMALREEGDMLCQVGEHEALRPLTAPRRSVSARCNLPCFRADFPRSANINGLGGLVLRYLIEPFLPVCILQKCKHQKAVVAHSGSVEWVIVEPTEPAKAEPDPWRITNSSILSVKRKPSLKGLSATSLLEWRPVTAFTAKQSR